MKSSLLLSLVAATLCGCAADPKPAPSSSPAASTSASADQDLSCDRETPTGTIFPTKRCRNAAQREEERKAVEATGDAIRRGNAAQPGKAGS